MVTLFTWFILLMCIHNSYSLFNLHKIPKILEDKSFGLETFRNNSLEILAYQKGLISTFKNANVHLTVSQTCAKDLTLIATALNNTILQKNETEEFLVNAVLPMFDSYGKIPSGILVGALTLWGYEPECSRINYKLSDRDFQGSYSRIFFNLGLQDGSKSENCDVKKDVFGSFDVCTPKSCANDEDLYSIATQFKVSTTNYSAVCFSEILENQKENVTYKTWIVIAVMSTLTIIGLLSSIIDYFVPSKWLPNSVAYRILQSCAITKNIQEIFTVKSGPKTGQIEPIHCIRFFSICWVVLGHAFQNIASSTNNASDIMLLLKDLTTQIVVNSYFSVDSFFFISGVLLAFLWLKEYEKNKASVMSPKAWIMFYVNRFLRLSPPYYLIIFFNAFVFYSIFIIKKPLLMDSSHVLDQVRESCKKVWWTHLLYINNIVYYETDECMGQSWYLATDMQMFIFTPILLIPLAIKPRIGFVISGLLLIGSTAANIWTVYKNHYGVGLPGVGYVDPEEKHLDQYALLIYSAPWIRCQIYIMGLLVGYFLRYTPKLNVNKLLNLILWALSLSLMLTVLLSLKNYMNGEKLTLMERALYSSLARPAWGLGLTWIIISCYYGYGGPINQFMSWNIWVPLSRLSYCVYLTHLNVLVYILSLTKAPLIFSGFPHFFATFALPTIFFTFLFSVYWSAMFEVPFYKIQMLLLRQKKEDKNLIDELPQKLDAQDITPESVLVTEIANKKDSWS